MPSSGNGSAICPARTVDRDCAREQHGILDRADGQPRGLVRSAHHDRRDQERRGSRTGGVLELHPGCLASCARRRVHDAAEGDLVVLWVTQCAA